MTPDQFHNNNKDKVREITEDSHNVSANMGGKKTEASLSFDFDNIPDVSDGLDFDFDNKPEEPVPDKIPEEVPAEKTPSEVPDAETPDEEPTDETAEKDNGMNLLYSQMLRTADNERAPGQEVTFYQHGGILLASAGAAGGPAEGKPSLCGKV